MSKREKYDVVVAGGGCSGVFAAVASAREGARTLLVERTGMLGGNSGPGLMFGCVNPFDEGPGQLLGGNAGLAAEVKLRITALSSGVHENRIMYSGLFSHVIHQMVDKYGVELATPAWASDPIVEENAVRGLWVETKSGRLEIRASQVIDATGEADVAMRAGCDIVGRVSADATYSPVIYERYDHGIDPDWSRENWNEAGLMFLISGIDWTAYRASVDRTDRIVTEGLPIPGAERRMPLRKRFPRAVMPLLDRAFADGSFRYAEELKPGLAIFWQYRMLELGPDLAESAISVQGDYDAGDWRDMAMLEHRMRRMSYEACEFLRQNVPGCSGCYLQGHSPFIGHRGGPFVEGGHVVTPEDIKNGARFDDVVIRAIWEVPKLEKAGIVTDRSRDGYDIPFRMIVPKGADNLLVTGRGASYIRRGHDPATRARIVQFHLGEVAGIAAAFCAASGQTPRRMDVKRLQRRLIEEGFTLGNQKRLQELGLGS